MCYKSAWCPVPLRPPPGEQSLFYTLSLCLHKRAFDRRVNEYGDRVLPVPRPLPVPTARRGFRTIDKYTKMYSTRLLHPPAPTKKTPSPHPSLLLPTLCRMPVRRALNLSARVYNLTLDVEKRRKTPLESSVPLLMCFVDIKRRVCIYCFGIWNKELR